MGAAGGLKSDTAIGAAVSLNVENVDSEAFIAGGATVSGNGVTVEATTPTGKNQFITWSLAAAASKNDASVAASVGIQVLSYTAKAYVGQHATITSTGDMKVHAKSPVGLLNLNLSGGFSEDGTAVGGAIAVNVLTVDTEAYIDSGATLATYTHVDVSGALLVKAEASLDPIAPTIPTLPGGVTPRIQSWVPALSSVAIAGGGSTGDPAVTGSVIVDVFNLTTTAAIDPHAQINSSTHGGGGQTVEVTATDDTHVINVAGGLAISTGGVGVGISVIVDVINKDVSASIGNGANVSAGGTVTVQALSTENLFELAIVGAVSTTSAASPAASSSSSSTGAAHTRRRPTSAPRPCTPAA